MAEMTIKPRPKNLDLTTIRLPLPGKHSNEPGLQCNADEIPNGWLEYIARAAAFRKDRHPDEPQQHIAAYGCRPQASAEQQPGQQRKEKLQREDLRSDRNLDEGTYRDQRDKECTEHEFP